MRRILLAAAIALSGLAVAAPVAALIHEETEDSFVVRQAVVVPASPAAAWDTLVRPSLWWSDAHSFSGDSANLSLHARAGGCFCEVLPGTGSATAASRGSVEHMRVVYAEDGRALRMVGALGPMQAEAVTGVLTIVLKPTPAGTQILWEYAVSGHFRKPGTAASIDALLTGQIARLAEKLGARGVSGWRPDQFDGDTELLTQPGASDEAVPDRQDPSSSDQPEPDFIGR